MGKAKSLEEKIYGALSKEEASAMDLRAKLKITGEDEAKVFSRTLAKMKAAGQIIGSGTTRAMVYKAL